jgi:hypothetical protein
VIATEWIDLRDTEFLFSLTDVDDLEGGDPGLDFSAEGEDGFGDPPPSFGDELLDIPDFELDDDFGFDFDPFDDDEPWRAERVFPRYQLQVMLRDEESVP